MNEIIDKKDKKILDVLNDNSRLSSHKISKKIAIPVTTVNNRIKKLRKLGVIKKYTIDVDKKKLGYALSAYVFITLSLFEIKEEKITVDDIITTIKKNPHVESIEHVTGEGDIIVKINVANIEDLNDYILNTLSLVKGIRSTTTSFILSES